MAIQLVKATSGAKIIAVDIDDGKLKIAKSNGADVAINSKKEDAAKLVMESTSKLGADAVIDFLNASKTTESCRDVF
jgi:propanol-preferring alcohol dehydrogenase